MQDIRRIVFIGLVVLGCIGCDQGSKIVAQHWLGDQRYSYLGDTVRLGVAENTGAFLGLGSQMDETSRYWLFVVLTGLFLLGVLLFVLMNKRVEGQELLAWSLLLGGGLGNFIDRAFRDGHVVDFMNIGIGSLRTGIFNVADMAIMAGAFILIFISFKRPRTERDSME